MLALLGFLLAGGAGAFTGLVIAYNTSGGPKYTPEIFSQSLATLNTLGVFCSGIALGLIFSFGVWLMVNGARRTIHHPMHGPRPAGGTGTAPMGSDFGAGHPAPQ